MRLKARSGVICLAAMESLRCFIMERSKALTHTDIAFETIIAGLEMVSKLRVRSLLPLLTFVS